MLVKNDIILESNEAFVNYIIKKCDMFSLTKYQDQHKEKHDKRIKIILSSNKYSKEDILNSKLIDVSNKIYDDFKDSKEIFDEDYRNKYENEHNPSYLIELNRKHAIVGSVNRYIYDYIVDNYIKQHENIIVKKREIILNHSLHHSTIYYFKINTDIEKELILKKSIFDWCYPYSMEDISFFSNGYCWLYSIAHEKICDIYCESEEEYEYLKSIGIEFVDECYIPISKDDLYCEKY